MAPGLKVYLLVAQTRSPWIFPWVFCYLYPGNPGLRPMAAPCEPAAHVHAQRYHVLSAL
jgi:hypothetical protein